MLRIGIVLALAAALVFPAGDAGAQMRGRGGFGGGGGMGPGGGMKGGGPPEEGGPGADLSPEERGAFLPRMADLDHMRAKGFMETGLTPGYPKEARCREVTSPFGVGYRGDGSPRARLFYGGLHGGMDIPAPGGTPILALAAGQVVHKSPGAEDGIGGIGLILQHAPEDTGLPLWTYTEYKHLREMPALEVGQRVEMGQVIAHVGNTGTTGGHYGPAGHHHLHLSAWAAPGPGHRAGRSFVPKDGEWVDPLALFRQDRLLKSAALQDLPASEKTVPLPYQTASGKVVPEGTKVVWPLACEGR